MSHVLVSVLLVVAAAPAVMADEPSPSGQTDRREAAVEQAMQLAQAPPAETATPAQAAQPPPPTARPLTAEEIVQAIKLRAQRELAQKRARKWSLSNFASWTFGDETNPNTAKARKSALYMEEYLSSTFSYRFVPQVTWQIGYSIDAQNYNEATDLSTLTNSLTTKLIYRPWKPIRLEAHYTFDDSEYPYDSGSSTWDQKIHLRLRHSFLKHYYHYIGWTYLNKQYQDKRTRDGAGNRIAGKYRKDQRHTMMYEIGGAFGEKTTLKLKQEAYVNRSNDVFQDFNDAQDYKVKISGSHDWTEQWSTTGAYTYELKRYERRDVTDRSGHHEAEQDYAQTYDAGITYKFDKDMDVTYSWKYKHQHSNDPAQTYGDVTHSLAFNVAF